jgi:DNA-binding protein H-NS
MIGGRKAGVWMVTLEQVQSRIAKLQKQAEELLRKKNASVIADIKSLLARHGLTTADIDAHTGTTKVGAKRGPKPGAKRAGKTTGAAVAKKAAPQTKGKLPPKYINPKTGETWSGHARPPAWIANVKDRTKFLIANGADTAVPTGADTVDKAKSAAKKGSAVSGATPRKGQPKGQQTAKYLDPKTGATWSGRGRAPAWLAGARDRSKFLIDGAAEVSAASEAKAPKKAVASKSATKAAAVKTTVAKKVVGEKVAAKKNRASTETTTQGNATRRKPRA